MNDQNKESGVWGTRILYRVGPEGKVPTKGYPGDAGFDLYTSKEVTIRGGNFREVPTDLELALPEGFWGHIVSRSSTWQRYGLHVTPAVIDNGYRGGMFICVVNPASAPVTIAKHTRLAQLILHKIYDVKWEALLGRQELPHSERGNRGFGSSGR